MDKKKSDMFEKILLEKKRQMLTRLMESSDKYHQFLKNDNVGDMADAAFDTYERYLLYDLSIAEKAELDAINAALTRIENKSFGVCGTCGKDISIDRLKAQPIAKLCIDCKTKEEAKEKRSPKKQQASVEEET